MNLADSYDLLRLLTTPVVAITSRRGDKLNGMVTDGCVRAGIVPDVPRIGVYIHKFNFTHDIVFETGRMGVHILGRGQVDTVLKLGFRSGRDHDKLAEVPHRVGPLDLPILEHCVAWWACEVVNAMDTGASTLFLGEAREWGRGPEHEPLLPSYLRSVLPEQYVEMYQKNLSMAQNASREMYKRMGPLRWRGLPNP